MTVPGVILLASLPLQGDPDSSALVQREFEELADEDALEHIAWFREHPVDLNTATLSQIEGIPGISTPEVLAIVALRRRVNGFSSWSDLRALGEDLFTRLRDFVVIKRTEPRRSTGRRRRGGVRVRFGRAFAEHAQVETAAGDGSPWLRRMYAEIPLWGSASFFLSAEADPGETVRHGCLGVSADLQGPGMLRGIVAGDYRLAAGQGVALSASGSYPGDPVAVVRAPGQPVSPRHSWAETGFLRGCALSLGPDEGDDGVSATLFFSHRLLAASLNQAGMVMSLDETGLVRTRGEVGRQHAVRETAFGVRVPARFSERADVGVSLYQHSLDRDWAPSLSQGLRDSRHRVVAVDCGLSFSPLTIAGEFASSTAGGTAWVLWCLIPATQSLRLVAGWKTFPPDFVAPLGRTSAARGGEENWRGGYLGWDLRLAPWCALSGSADVGRSLTRSHLEHVPELAAKLVLQCDIRVTRETGLTFRLGLGEAERSARSADGWGRESRRTFVKRSVSERFTLSHSPFRGLRFRTRMEYGRVVPPGEPAATALLVFQEVRWNPVEPVSVTGRVTLADPDSYDSRLYAAEPDPEGIAFMRSYSRRCVVLHVAARATLPGGLRVGAGVRWSETPGWEDGTGGTDERAGMSAAEIAVAFSAPL